MSRCPKWVAMGRHGVVMGGNESYGFWEAFGTPPGPPGDHKKNKNVEQLKHPGFQGRRHEAAAWEISPKESLLDFKSYS